MKAVVPVMIARAIIFSALLGCGSTAAKTGASSEISRENEGFARNRCGGAEKPVEEVPGGLILRRSLPGFSSVPFSYDELWLQHAKHRGPDGHSHTVSPRRYFDISCVETSPSDVAQIQAGEMTDTVLRLVDGHLNAWGGRSMDMILDVNKCKPIITNWPSSEEYTPGKIVAHTMGGKQNGSFACIFFEYFYPLSFGPYVPR